MGRASSRHGRGGEAPRFAEPSGDRGSPAPRDRCGSERETALAPRCLVAIEARTVATDGGDTRPPRSGARQVDERRRGEGVRRPGTRRATRATGPGDRAERTRTERGARRSRDPQENGGGRGARPSRRYEGGRRRPEATRSREGVPHRSRKAHSVRGEEAGGTPQDHRGRGLASGRTGGVRALGRGRTRGSRDGPQREARRSREDDREYEGPRTRTRGPGRRTEGPRLDAREARHRVEQDRPGDRKAQGGTRSARQGTQGREGPPGRGRATGRRRAESLGAVQG